MFYLHADHNYLNILNNYKGTDLNHYGKFDFWNIYLFFELFQSFCLNNILLDFSSWVVLEYV